MVVSDKGVTATGRLTTPTFFSLSGVSWIDRCRTCSSCFNSAPKINLGWKHIQKKHKKKEKASLPTPMPVTEGMLKWREKLSRHLFRKLAWTWKSPVSGNKKHKRSNYEKWRNKMVLKTNFPKSASWKMKINLGLRRLTLPQCYNSTS